MKIEWQEELWEPFELSAQPSFDFEDLSPKPRKRSFMELDSDYEFEVPGVFPSFGHCVLPAEPV